MTTPINRAAEATQRAWEFERMVQAAAERATVYAQQPWERAEAEFEEQRDQLDPARGYCLMVALLLAIGAGVLLAYWIIG